MRHDYHRSHRVHLRRDHRPEPDRAGRFLGRVVRPVPQLRPDVLRGVGEAPSITFGKVDTEAEQNLAAAAGIRSIPTLMAFRDSVLVFSQPGALNSASLEELITGVENLDMNEVRASIAGHVEPTLST